MNRLMTAAEAASYAQVNVRTIYRKACSGDLKCYRLGRAVRFKQEDIDEAMTGGEKCQKRRNEAPKQPRK